MSHARSVATTLALFAVLFVLPPAHARRLKQQDIPVDPAVSAAAAPPDAPRNISRPKQACISSIADLQLKPTRQFRWPGCITTNTTLVYTGSNCSSLSTADDTTSLTFEYTQVSAVDAVTNTTNSFRGKPCIMQVDSTKPASWNQARFGSCGVAPRWALNLPTSMCNERIIEVLKGGGGRPGKLL